MSMLKTFAAAAAATVISITAVAAQQADGSADAPYRVMLVPADGGTADGTIADFTPVFNAVTEATGLNFDINVGQSYGAVIEAICADAIDVAWFGPASYVPAHERGCAELLAVDVKGGESVYYSGFYARADSGIESLADIKGKSIALGDPNSTSSFVIPVYSMVDAGIDPIADMTEVRIVGSHANALQAVQQGNVDVSASSFSSYNKAIGQGAIDPDQVVPIFKSKPLPNPPLALRSSLSDDVKATLRKAISTVHEAEGIEAGMIRGYGGKQVDRYDADITEDLMAPIAGALKVVGPVREAILRAEGN
ncbi:MAG: phosphate/phosphite/phosphonate ABC transporter substrate-binding protein [Rhodovulum sp.]